MKEGVGGFFLKIEKTFKSVTFNDKENISAKWVHSPFICFVQFIVLKRNISNFTDISKRTNQP